MNSEERVRVQLRARAWDVAAALPEALELPGPIDEVLTHGEYEVVVTLRRRSAPAAPPREAVSLAPVQRYLLGCWLTEAERLIVSAIAAAGNEPRHMAWLRDHAFTSAASPPSEGLLKMYLARLADPGVGILSSHRRQGYRLTPHYIAFLAWVEKAQAEGLLSAA